MEEIKMKVVSKRLDGGVETADVTMDDENNVTAVTSEVGPSIPGSDITSEGANAGDVLTADGSDGADWQAPSGGTQLYKHTIYFEADGEELILIDNDSSPITEATIEDRFVSRVSAFYRSVQNSPELLNLSVDLSTHNTYFMYSTIDIINQSGTLTCYWLDSSNITDTVTPL